MKIFLSSLLILLISNSSFACKADEVKVDDKVYSICRIGKYGFLSKECKNVLDCFPVKGEKVVLLPTQNPAFTLCQNIKGKPMSGEAKWNKSIESACVLKGKIVDMNELMKAR